MISSRGAHLGRTIIESSSSLKNLWPGGDFQHQITGLVSGCEVGRSNYFFDAAQIEQQPTVTTLDLEFMRIRVNALSAGMTNLRG